METKKEGGFFDKNIFVYFVQIVGVDSIERDISGGEAAARGRTRSA